MTSLARAARVRGAVALPWTALLLVWLATTVYMLARLPVLPRMLGDSPQYINGTSNRPPGYVWMLQLWQAVVGADYAYLPQLQTVLIALTLLALAWQLALLLRSPLAATVVIPLAWAHRSTWETTRFVMSEGLFLPAFLAMLALAAAHARTRSTTSLAGVAFCCALAILARNTAAALLVLPVLLVLLDRGEGLRLTLRRLAVVALVTALPLIAGMAWHKARHGVFALGTYVGLNLAGKSMLLLRPELATDAVLAQVLPQAEEARAAIAAAPSYAASLRAQFQAMDNLRWRVFQPAAAAIWPAWREGDLAMHSRIALPVGLPIIAADPAGFVRLTLRDWSALILYPNFWPWSADNSPHPFFANCAEARDRCWVFQRLLAPPSAGLVMLGTSLAGLVLAVVLLLRLAGHARSGQATPPEERLMLAMVATTHAMMAGTVVFEFGLWRYSLAPHVMHAALISWVGAWVLRAGILPPAARFEGK